MAKIKYVGNQPIHVDHLYGTRTRWAGNGDVQSVEPDELAQKMVTAHPDCYAHAAQGDAGSRVLTDPGAKDPADDSNPPGGDGNDGADNSGATGDGDDSNAGDVVMMGSIPLGEATKDEIVAFAQETYGVKLAKQSSVEKLRAQVRELMEKAA